MQSLTTTTSIQFQQSAMETQTLYLSSHDPSLKLTLLPPELLIQVYARLPTFRDVFALADTTLSLRRIWNEHTGPIYSTLAPYSIECESAARRLLADQGGADPKSSLTVKDVHQLLHNQQVMIEALRKFEESVVRRIRVGRYSVSHYYGEDARRHPLTLTTSERRRFASTYYGVWGLMLLSESECYARLCTFPLKKLYEMYELAPFVEGRRMPGLERGDAAPWGFDNQTDARNPIEQRLKELYREVHGLEWEDVSAEALFDGAWGIYVVLWDHWRDNLKDACKARWRRSRKGDLDGVILTKVWVDSDDEE